MLQRYDCDPVVELKIKEDPLPRRSAQAGFSHGLVPLVACRFFSLKEKPALFHQLYEFQKLIFTS